MSRNARNIVLIPLMLFALYALSAPCAQANDDLYREGTTAQKMFRKLGRGATNIFTGWMEIPKNISKQWRAYDPFTGFFVGGVEGVAWGVGRTMVGVYDTVTFFLPIPADYEPLMEPEFILPGIWGDPLPLMDPVSKLEPLR